MDEIKKLGEQGKTKEMTGEEKIEKIKEMKKTR